MGRPLSNITNYFAAGVCTLLLGTATSSSSMALIYGYGALLTANAAAAATWVMTPELFDTKVRSTAHAILTALSRVAAFTSRCVRGRKPTLPKLPRILTLPSQQNAISNFPCATPTAIPTLSLATGSTQVWEFSRLVCCLLWSTLLRGLLRTASPIREMPSSVEGGGQRGAAETNGRSGKRAQNRRTGGGLS